jgi:nitrogen fixation-related uncharacterized protein
MYIAFGICALFFVVGVAAMYWAFRNGEFENMEDTKFEMLDDNVDGQLGLKAKAKFDRLRTGNAGSKS